MAYSKETTVTVVIPKSIMDMLKAHVNGAGSKADEACIESLSSGHVNYTLKIN
jgi:hypothetical protein